MLSIILICLCSWLWQKSGRGGFPNAKLLRRIGSTACCLIIIWLQTKGNLKSWAIATPLVYFGCASYFEKANYVVKLWWKDINLDKEYWFNFLLQGLCGQLSVLALGYSTKKLLLSFVIALFFAFGKIWIDNTTLANRDALSEYFCGLVMALGVAINIL